MPDESDSLQRLLDGVSMNSFAARLAIMLMALIGLAAVAALAQTIVVSRRPRLVEPFRASAKRMVVAGDRGQAKHVLLQVFAVLGYFAAALAFLWCGFTMGLACGFDNYATGPLRPFIWHNAAFAVVVGAAAIALIDLLMSLTAAFRRRIRIPRAGLWTVAVASLSFAVGIAPAGLVAYLGASHHDASPLSVPAGIALVAVTALGAACCFLVAGRAVGTVWPMSALLSGFIAIAIGCAAPIPMLIEGRELRQDNGVLNELVATLGSGEITYWKSQKTFTTDTAVAHSLGVMPAGLVKELDERAPVIALPSANLGNGGQTVCLSMVSPSGKELTYVVSMIDPQNPSRHLVMTPPDAPPANCDSMVGADGRSPDGAFREGRAKLAAGTRRYC